MASMRNVRCGVQPLLARERPYHLLALADLHAGSRFGLWPSEFTLEDGGKTEQNKFQKWLWEKWQEMITALPNRVDACIVNGDAIDGEARPDGGRFSITTNMADQARGAAACLRLLRPKIKTFFLTRGTPFHEGAASEAVEILGAEIKAEKWSEGRYAGQVLERSWHGLTLNIAHHQTAGWIYPAGSGDRISMFSAIGEGIGKLPHADIIIRAHLHQLRIVRAYGRWVILLPAWEVTTPYALKRMEPTRATVAADIGAVLLSVDRGQVSIKTLEFILPPGEVLELVKPKERR